MADGSSRWQGHFRHFDCAEARSLRHRRIWHSCFRGCTEEDAHTGWFQSLVGFKSCFSGWFRHISIEVSINHVLEWDRHCEALWIACTNTKRTPLTLRFFLQGSPRSRNREIGLNGIPLVSTAGDGHPIFPSASTGSSPGVDSQQSMGADMRCNMVQRPTGRMESC